MTEERKAADFFGVPLAVGDEVATLLPRYRYTLAAGKVVKITPKALRVAITESNYHGTGKSNTTEHTVYEGQVVKRHHT